MHCDIARSDKADTDCKEADCDAAYSDKPNAEISKGNFEIPLYFTLVVMQLDRGCKKGDVDD